MACVIREKYWDNGENGGGRTENDERGRRVRAVSIWEERAQPSRERFADERKRDDADARRDGDQNGNGGERIYRRCRAAAGTRGATEDARRGGGPEKRADERRSLSRSSPLRRLQRRRQSQRVDTERATDSVVHDILHRSTTHGDGDERRGCEDVIGVGRVSQDELHARFA